MNIRSLFKAFIPERPAAVENEQPKQTTNQPVSKGIASVPDSFETSSINFFGGEKLDADSLREQQDYSREIFDPHKRYSGVVMQQGRVQTDSDSNESTDVKRNQEKIFLRDSAFSPFKDDDD